MRGAAQRPRVTARVDFDVILVFSRTGRLQPTQTYQPIVYSAYGISAWFHPQEHATLREWVHKCVVFQMYFVAWPLVALGAK